MGRFLSQLYLITIIGILLLLSPFAVQGRLLPAVHRPQSTMGRDHFHRLLQTNNDTTAANVSATTLTNANVSSDSVEGDSVDDANTTDLCSGSGSSSDDNGKCIDSAGCQSLMSSGSALLVTFLFGCITNTRLLF